MGNAKPPKPFEVGDSVVWQNENGVSRSGKVICCSLIKFPGAPFWRTIATTNGKPYHPQINRAEIKYGTSTDFRKA